MQSSLTRRGFLLVSAATIVAPALPAPILAAAPVAPILTPVTTVLTPLPAWAVGPEDSFGWLATRAATLEEAIEIYRVENDYADTDDHISGLMYQTYQPSGWAFGVPERDPSSRRVRP